MFQPLKINIKVFCLALALMWSVAVRAEERPSVTPSEYQVFRHGSVDHADDMRTSKTTSVGMYAIEEAIFHLAVSRESACGKVCLSGRILNGVPKRIPIMGDDFVITDIQEVMGGSLLCDFGTGPRIFLLPDESRVFKVTLSFMLAAQEDNRSSFISLGIAPALENILFLEHTPDICIEVLPGEVDPQGMVHVSSGKHLLVRFNETTPL